MAAHHCLIPFVLCCSLGAADLTLLTVGDSLTDLNKYQTRLVELLVADGHQVVRVGSRGPDDARHEGYSGWRINQINDEIVGWLDATQPNVVTVQIGTNNMNHGLGLSGGNYPTDADGRAVAAQFAEPIDGSYLNGVGSTWNDPTYGTVYLTNQINTLLDAILDHASSPQLAVALIPPIGKGHPDYHANNDNCVARIEEYNDLLRAAVAARAQAGKPVAIADNYTGIKRAYGTVPDESDFGDSNRQSSDWVHPHLDAAAWNRMGEGFHAAITTLLSGAEPLGIRTIIMDAPDGNWTWTIDPAEGEVENLPQQIRFSGLDPAGNYVFAPAPTGIPINLSDGADEDFRHQAAPPGRRLRSFGASPAAHRHHLGPAEESRISLSSLAAAAQTRAEWPL